MHSAELIRHLRLAVAERVRVIAGRAVPTDGRHVLYWMHHAVRGHENPALDAALLAACALDRPVLVYQGLGGGHPCDNDRHHTFILEGARDVRDELAARHVTHALSLGDDPRGPSPLRALARSAALVVTEDFPAPPFPGWTERLTSRIEAPVWAVDTACVVPMQLLGRAFDRAFAFRAAIQDLLDGRLSRPWTEVEEVARRFDPADLPFADVDFAATAIPELVARCPIDHTVGPVAHTPGGARAGYARWEAFRSAGLTSYASRRNDATRDGVSRMSPYLHHGHVSPHRIAREANEAGGKGAEKFLDELIVWRELAHNLCFHRSRDLESLSVLPRWAQETLAAHADDPRRVRSWETLARGRTGDALWDLLQTSLVRHGELHNNVRMTWGKAIPQWAADPTQALELLLDLNHRFALDGSDPNSYGGLLWCLGLFDRPFTPEQPVLGAVRARSLAAHAERLDVDRYAKHVRRPPTQRPLRVAVVGAGLSGLVCARTLADHGHVVEVYDKGRSAGGRMSTREQGAWRFDHGAQYFTVRDPRFARWVESWRQDGVVAPWTGTVAVLRDGRATPKESDVERFVGMPAMRSVCAHLAADLQVAYGMSVERLAHVAGRWQLSAAEGGDLGRFDAVVVSAPAPQAAALLAAEAPGLAARAAGVSMAPCWAVLVGFSEPLDLGFDAAFVHGAPLSWIMRGSSKPGRPASEAWVLHAGPDWSRAHLERSREDAAAELLAAFGEALGGAVATPEQLSAHRWRYALPTEPLADPCLFDPDRQIAACGDWCGGPRVEGAFLSGAAAAGRLLALQPDPPQRTLFE